MTVHTVKKPQSFSDPVYDSTAIENHEPKGVANSFKDSHRRRHRKPPTNPRMTGFTQSAPTPLPKRPKGRFLVAAFLLSLLMGFMYTIWNAFFSVVAYGTIEGRKLEMTPLQTSVIRTIYVRDGQYVQQGDPLFTLEKIDFPEKSKNRLEHQLNAALHDFKVEIAKHRVNASLSNNQKAKARAEYLHWLGELMLEQSILDKLIDQHQLTRRLTEQRAIGAAELRSIEFELRGQRAKVEKLSLAVEQLEKNAASIESDVDFTDLIHAHQEKIKGLQQRLHTQKSESITTTVKAPVTGKVIRICHFTGERVEPGEPLMELIEGGSLRPVLYMSQEKAAALQPGHSLQIEVKPAQTLVDCTVERIADEFQPVPTILQGKMKQKGQVVAVYLKPDSPELSREIWRLGGLIELPHRFSFSDWLGNSPSRTKYEPSEHAVYPDSRGRFN